VFIACLLTFLSTMTLVVSSRHLGLLWVAVEATADGRLAPVVDVTVPQRALVFSRRTDGSYQARLEASVTAMRGDVQVGGGVGQSTARVVAVDDARSDTPIRVRVPLRLRGEEPVRLIVKAAQPGTARRWQQELALSPATLASAPLVIERVVLSPEASELFACDDTLVVTAVCVRPSELADWPAEGVAVELEVSGPAGEVAGVRTILVRSAPGAGEAPQLPLVWAARDLPFGRLRANLALSWRHDDESLRLPHQPTLEVVNLAVPVDSDEGWRRHVDWLDGLVDKGRRGSLRGLPHVIDIRKARLQHLRRIVEADSRYGGVQRGALTDRGRVHIRWGEPALVEQVADAQVPGAVWEFWTYPVAGLRFVFHDAHGLGDFRLRRTEAVPR